MKNVPFASVVLMCERLQENLSFFMDQLGFRLDRISPADNPRLAAISGHGLHVELRVGPQTEPTTLCLTLDEPSASVKQRQPLVAPNGTRIEFAALIEPLELPALREELVVTHMQKKSGWGVGRAGMRYRDLIPGRLGGRLIASHIQIPGGGPVPDFVHFHQIRFQMIFCVKGWVRVLYEDQGEPLLLEAGDCFLQPPLIRHRVLESSAGLEVVEIASPAEHDTFVDHELELPTPEFKPERDFSGQRFVHHRASLGQWVQRKQTSFEARDLEIAASTAGLASAKVLRVKAKQSADKAFYHEGELLFLFVQSGQLDLADPDQESYCLHTGDSITIPSGTPLTPTHFTDDLQLLEVQL